MGKLTGPQVRVISKLSSDRWETAYSLKESRTVLESLVKKGLVKKLLMPGSFAFPRTSIGYRLVDK